MINYRKLLKSDSYLIDKLIAVEKDNYEVFLRMGWSTKQVLNHLNKNTNLSFGGFNNDSLISFILGDVFNIEKISEYEILLIYVSKNFRDKGSGTKLVNIIEENINCLKKIYLEVSEKNLSGISFYKKMNFQKIYMRKNYFSNQDNKVNAFVMSKKY